MQPRPMKESAFQAQVLQLATLFRWGHYHTRDSRRSKAGFPDLVLWRERVIYVELKTDTGRLSRDQIEVTESLIRAKAEVYVWRPRNWARIEATLRG